MAIVHFDRERTNAQTLGQFTTHTVRRAHEYDERREGAEWRREGECWLDLEEIKKSVIRKHRMIA